MGVIRRTEYEHQIDGEGVRRETVETQDLAQHSVEVGTNTKGELSLRSSKFYFAAGDDLNALALRQDEAVRLALASAKGELTAGMTRGESDWRDVAYALAEAIFGIGDWYGDDNVAKLVEQVRGAAALDPRGSRKRGGRVVVEPDERRWIECVVCLGEASVIISGDPMCGEHGAKRAERQVHAAPAVGDAPAAAPHWGPCVCAHSRAEHYAEVGSCEQPECSCGEYQELPI